MNNWLLSLLLLPLRLPLLHTQAKALMQVLLWSWVHQRRSWW
jgi:ABC-type transport system involved in cytochrome c biogenesis permease component